MRKFSMVGYWNTGDKGEEDYIQPQDIVTTDVIADKEKIIAYLKSGKIVIGYFGWADCRICGEELGSVCVSDGMWMWPEKLEHYVDAHNIKLPDEFIQHARSSNWTHNYAGNGGMGGREIMDNSFWKTWCSEVKKKRVIYCALEIDPERFWQRILSAMWKVKK